MTSAHLTPLIQDLTIILALAAVVTFVCRLLKQPVVLGYIITGVIVGPYTPPVFSVIDAEGVQVWAELGVIFLMFALGLEFSFRRLAKVGLSAGATAGIQMGTMVLCGYGAARAMGWTAIEGIFTGCMVSISSTTIIIKAFEELGLKTQRFAELVFGALIVEDLVAIVMLVALSGIATRASMHPVDLVIIAGKLAFVVSIWLIIGMFIVPRLVKAIGRRGNDELFVVGSLGLCLAMTALAVRYQYSVALGAFIMGSILAETREAARIERLIAPLKDLFGAVFFVTVGMLIDPSQLVEHVVPILILTAVVIGGKVMSVALGALVTGQTVRTSLNAGFGMAQIGEFSFIIAGLGLAHKAIAPSLYPIIVSVSVVTTLTTPYLLKACPAVVDLLERWLPRQTLLALRNYATRLQRAPGRPTESVPVKGTILRWLANGALVVALFSGANEWLRPIVERSIPRPGLAATLTWLLTMVAAAPFVGAMFNSFRAAREQSDAREPERAIGLMLSRMGTVILVGALSMEFSAPWLAVLITSAVIGAIFVIFKAQVDRSYQWIESTFIAGIKPTTAPPEQDATRLAPWDSHLVEMAVHPESTMAGQTLLELQLPERYGISVVVIRRHGHPIVAPRATERLFPGDGLLCLGDDNNLRSFQSALDQSIQEESAETPNYELKSIAVSPTSAWVAQSIRNSKIREQFDCIVVGVERGQNRIQNPRSDFILQADDHLWVVGESKKMRALLEGEPAPH